MVGHKSTWITRKLLDRHICPSFAAPNRRVSDVNSIIVVSSRSPNIIRISREITTFSASSIRQNARFRPAVRRVHDNYRAAFSSASQRASDLRVGRELFHDVASRQTGFGSNDTRQRRRQSTRTSGLAGVALGGSRPHAVTVW